MGNNQDNYADDPYIKQSQQNNAIKNLYSNQSLSSYDREVDSRPNLQQLSEQQEKRNTVAYQNPIKIDRNSIKLERDAYNPNIYYIIFEYTCDRTVYANFYFNAEFNPSNGNAIFIPSEPFQNKTINIWFPAAQKAILRDPNLKVDVDYFLRNKVYGKKYIDLIMELYVMDNSKQNAECILATFCSINFRPNTNDFQVKYLFQKVKVQASEWYHIEDVFGLTSEDNLCEICCCNERNTFFLPCKHSYTCQDCAILIRTKDAKCPICRQKIADSVVLQKVNENTAPPLPNN